LRIDQPLRRQQDLLRLVERFPCALNRGRIDKLTEQSLLGIQLALQLLQRLPELEVIGARQDLARAHPIPDLNQHLLELPTFRKAQVLLGDGGQRT
jgi:hypothetical protein